MSALYTVKEVAARLGVKEDTIHYWRRVGRLGCVTTGPKYIRFTEAQISAFIDENSTGGPRHVRQRR